MELQDILTQLQELGDESVRKRYLKSGGGENQYGVKLGDIRTLAKKIETNHELALQLWKTGNLDAQLLAILLFDVKAFSPEDIDKMVRSIEHVQVADWFNAYVIKVHTDNEELRVIWMKSDNPMAARAGWSLTSGQIAKKHDGLDVVGLLDRIEDEMATAPSEVQWTMNTALAQIGIHHPALRERALEIGERLGIYRDYPVSKGCTSPFAPIWINEMVKRHQ